MTASCPSFLYFGLDDHSRELLTLICGETEWVELAPLDKGLSGSTVLMGRWSVSGTPSKFHVFKIGDPAKLRREYDAIVCIAAPLVRNFPNAVFRVSADESRAILSQEFMGDSDGSTRSLRQFIEAASDEREVVEVLERLYTERIIDWIPKKPQAEVITTVRDDLGSWIRKGDLQRAASEIGEIGIKKQLIDRFNLELGSLVRLTKLILDSTIRVEKGPVHGDLHAQNIIVDHTNRISLIDFGWTAVRWRAIDYLWLECSLKFVVASPYASIDDLLAMDELIDAGWSVDDNLNTSPLDECLHAPSLKNIAAGIGVIRRNARKHIPSLTLQDYRKGLIAMSFALTTFPQLNRVYLLHSMARNALALAPDLHSEGPYQRLYRPTQLLWPSRPGRMVKKAAERFSTPGRALDIGCGDGKDVVYLDDRGWRVTGFDINSIAVASVEQRAKQHYGSIRKLEADVIRADATSYVYPAGEYDLVVAYGLYHCLDDENVALVHRGIVSSLRSGGLLAFATFNNSMPIPTGHGTDDLFLRDPEHIFRIAGSDFDVVEREIGQITEQHHPLDQNHSHGLTWALLKKK